MAPSDILLSGERSVGLFKYRPHSKIVKGLLIFALLGCVTIAHLYVTSESTGLLLVLDHVFNIILVLAMLAVCASTGSCVLMRCGVALEQPIETLLFSIAIGAGILATSILIIGLLSGLQGLTLGLLLFSYAFLTRKELLRLPVSLVESLSRLKTHSSILCLLFFGAVALFMISMAVTPPLDWDGLMYHLRVPAQFLEHGRIYLPEDNPHTAYVGLAHMLYLPLMAFGSQSGPALISAFFALALGLAVFEFCAQFLTDSTAGLSLCSLWGSIPLLLIAITPRVDVTLAFYLFLAHYALLKALSGPADQPLYFLSAGLLGQAVGIKYTALVYVLALTPLILRAACGRVKGAVRCIHPLVVFAVLVLGASLPWFAKDWLLIGSPIYPFLGGWKIDPWLASFYPDQKVGLAIVKGVLRWQGQVSGAFNIFTLVKSPGALMVEAEGSLYYPNPIFLLLPLWVFVIRRNNILNWLMVPAISYVMILALYWPYSVVRYLIPAVAPFTIASVHIAERAWARFFSAKRTVELSALLTGVVLVPFGIILALCLSGTGALKYVTGTFSTRQYMLTNPFPLGSQTYSQMAFFVNGHIQQTDRVLMIYEARGYYFIVPVIQDNALTNWPLLMRTDAVSDCLRSTGISHVLLNYGALGYYIRRGLDPEVLQWEAFQKFAQRCLTPVQEGQGFALFRVKN